MNKRSNGAKAPAAPHKRRLTPLQAARLAALYGVSAREIEGILALMRDAYGVDSPSRLELLSGAYNLRVKAYSRIFPSRADGGQAIDWH